MTDWPEFLDPFVTEYRDDPSEENRERLLAAQAVQHEHFLREQTIDFMARTIGDARD